MSDGSETRKGQSTRLLAVLSVNFIGTLGFSLVIPFMVFLVTRLGGNAVIYGALGATYSAFQFLGAPVLGSWSDRYGRRRILLLSQAGTFAAWMIFLLALSLPTAELMDIDSSLTGAFTLTLPLLILFVARALDGITGGNISVANAYLADITDEKNRSRNFGRMAMSSNLGFILGPAMAGLLGATALGEVLPVAAAAVVSLAAMVLIYFGLPESRPCVADLPFGPTRRALGAETKGCFNEAPDRPSLKTALAIRGMPMMLALYFLIFLGFSFFYASFPMYASQELGWGVATLGTYFSVLSGMMILVQGPLLSRLSRKLADTTLIVSGSLLLGSSFVLLATATQVLSWSANAKDFKAIFIAGNEPFTQGQVHYAESCKAAIANGIVVNTIHCGPRQTGINTKWQHGAQLADGAYTHIDQNKRVVHITAPQDAEIAKLNTALNGTYVYYGRKGKEAKERQVAQDEAAADLAAPVLVQRAAAKSSALYNNAMWDLVDAIEQKKVKLEDLKDEDLPAELRKLKPAERKAYLAKMAKQRSDIRAKIQALAKARKLHVAAEMKKRAAADGAADRLDDAIVKSVREQAKKKDFKFEK